MPRSFPSASCLYRKSVPKKTESGSTDILINRFTVYYIHRKPICTLPNLCRRGTWKRGKPWNIVEIHGFSGSSVLRAAFRAEACHGETGRPPECRRSYGAAFREHRLPDAGGIRPDSPVRKPLPGCIVPVAATIPRTRGARPCPASSPPPNDASVRKDPASSAGRTRRPSCAQGL